MMVTKMAYFQWILILLVAVLFWRGNSETWSKEVPSSTVSEERELGTRIVFKWQSYPVWSMTISSRSKMLVAKTTKPYNFGKPKRKDIFTRGWNRSRMNKTMISTKKSIVMSKMMSKMKSPMMNKNKGKSMSKKRKRSSSKGVHPKKIIYRRRPNKEYGNGKGKGRSSSKLSRRPTRPTRRPPYRSPTVSPIPRPTPDSDPDISTDFSSATTETPLLLFALAKEGTEVVVDLSLPKGNRVDELYIVRGENVVPGSSCPPVGGSLIPINRRRRTASVPLDGMSSIVALCVDGVTVAQSYYVFESPAAVGGGEVVSEYSFMRNELFVQPCILIL